MRAAFADHPRIVIWEMTRSCALACRHCRAEAQPRRHPLELDAAEAERLLDQVAEAQPQFFILTGGDPTNRRDLEIITRRARDRGLRVALSPSATPRLAASDFRVLRFSGIDRMSRSLDGATRASHDAFRGVPGTWDWTMQAYASARAAGIEVQINTTFSASNVHELPGFAKIIRSLRPELWSIFLLVPTGRATRAEMLDGREAELLFHRLLDFSGWTGIPVKTTEAPHFRRVVQQRRSADLERPAQEFAPTNDGRGCIFISHIGEIQPSGFLPIACGNVKCGNLLEVYRNSPVFRALRDPGRLGGKCGRCEYRAICGGSRARAYAVTGDFLAPEPACNYQPAGAAPATALS